MPGGAAWCSRPMHGPASAGEDGGVPNRAHDDAITQLIRQGRDREAAELGSERLAPASTRGRPMDPISQLDTIVPLLNGLVAPLAGDDEALAAPTPCSQFCVRQVLEHMVGGATAFAAAFRGAEAPAGPLPDDLVAAFPQAMASLQDAMRSPGALDRTIAAPFGEVPGEVFGRFVALDGLVHGWDIATATGRSYDPPAEVVADVDGFARAAIGDAMRGETFAPATEPPAGASAVERLVAFTGRTVA
jgi:uncharacterized protein (TIGR03086 family)